MLDDILLISTGNQISADATVVEAEGLEIDESLLTGEADPIRKQPGDAALSGSFVVAGQAYVRVTAVGQASYAGTLAVRAKQEKKQDTPLMRTLNTIIRVLAIAIVPVGLLLFYSQYTNSGQLSASVLGATAAMIGMIPEGLILLTGVTLTVGALKLAQRKALVQSLYGIETLARVDVLCLDKTGTITDGSLTLEETLPMEGASAEDVQTALAELLAALKDNNATATALRKEYGGGGNWAVERVVPFSSARKYSAASFEGLGSYVMGAPGFVLPAVPASFFDEVDQYGQKGYRVLCLAHSGQPLPEEGLPEGLACIGLVILSDTIRPEAAETFRFFANEGVTLKVISGDDALTVSTIAGKAGIGGATQFVDMSRLQGDEDFAVLVEKYTVFGRVSPEQKRELVAALKQNGHTVCMTGDGVNDVLAMKEANCGVAMINGSAASRSAADFVLMTSDFSAMIDVLREGRRVINNIENVACLYLVKTIYSILLSVLYNFIPYPYPFAPLQMTPINTITVGIPSFFLALRSNYKRPKGRFMLNVIENSLPAALVVVFNVLVVQLAGVCFGLSPEETSTMNVLLTGAVGFSLLFRITRPLKTREISLLLILAVAFLLCVFVFGNMFDLVGLFNRNAFFYLPLIYVSPRMFLFLRRHIRRTEAMMKRRGKRNNSRVV